jgi:energy-coupling factor transport system ATP-binding protein
LNNIIESKNLIYAYETGPDNKKNEVLHGIDLSVQDGEFLAVIGHNGSGKSTLAKHFNGILLPTEGDILVDGINTKDEDRLLEIRQRVGMVFQNPDNQIVATVVEEDVAFGPENLGGAGRNPPSRG